MKRTDDSIAFSRALNYILEEFNLHEAPLRSQYNNLADQDHEGRQKKRAMLERATRRFLIDPLLVALGWNPNDPGAVAEEARAWCDGERVYFDYLGLTPDTRNPVLMVEAKGFDAKYPENLSKHAEARGSIPGLLAAILTEMKAPTGKSVSRVRDPRSEISGEWREWLTSLRDYVRSLGCETARNLSRVVITSGRWLIAFEQPRQAFSGEDRVEEEHISCFRSHDEMRMFRSDLFELLRRDNLVDTLPLMMSLQEAVALIRPETIEAWCRGTVVATNPTGAARRTFPTRTAYAAIVIWSGSRVFAVADYKNWHTEPSELKSYDQPAYDAFLSGFQATAHEHERAFWMCMRRDPPPVSVLETIASRGTAGLPSRAKTSLPNNVYVFETGESREYVEFLVLTGAAIHYKRATDPAMRCGFHDFEVAERPSFTAKHAKIGFTMASFTDNLQPTHCEHELHRVARASRCEVQSLESHLCCKACAFDSVCWRDEQPVDACPTK